jgi:hypothetical protein
MKLVLCLAGLAALAAAPATADNGQIFDWNAQQRAFALEGPPTPQQCFNGKFIVGANRAGASTLYVQSRQGGIYKVRLGAGCEALDSAEKITLRSAGSDAICDRHSGEVVVHTIAGARHCRASDIRKLTSPEVAALSRAPQQ